MQIINRMEVDAASAKMLGEAIAANQPQPIVHVPAPVVNIAAPAAVPAPVVNVAAPSVTVEAAKAPVIMVAAPVIPAPVVHVQAAEKRGKLRAVEMPDGSVELEEVQVQGVGSDLDPWNPA